MLARYREWLRIRPKKVATKTERGCQMLEDRFLVCDEKDWEGLTQDQREWMLYKTMRSIDRRLTNIEGKGWTHKAYAAAGGIIGGAIAAIGIKWAG